MANILRKYTLFRFVTTEHQYQLAGAGVRVIALSWTVSILYTPGVSL